MAGPMGGGGFGGGIYEGTTDVGNGIISSDFFQSTFERMYNSVDELIAFFITPLIDTIEGYTTDIYLIDRFKDALTWLFEKTSLLNNSPLELVLYFLPFIVILTLLRKFSFFELE